ncbi:MAG: hypothetical protein AAF561_01990 [Planctomycetota bacterium]
MPDPIESAAASVATGPVRRHEAPLEVPEVREVPRAVLASQREAAEAMPPPADVDVADVAAWSARLDGWFASGATVAVWHCDETAARFLATCDPDRSRVQLCVDEQPGRHGRFVPTSGHEVVRLSVLREERPDVVIVSSVAVDEVRVELQVLGVGPVELVELDSIAFG